MKEQKKTRKGKRKANKQRQQGLKTDTGNIEEK